MSDKNKNTPPINVTPEEQKAIDTLDKSYYTKAKLEDEPSVKETLLQITGISAIVSQLPAIVLSPMAGLLSGTAGAGFWAGAGPALLFLGGGAATIAAPIVAGICLWTKSSLEKGQRELGETNNLIESLEKPLLEGNPSLKSLLDNHRTRAYTKYHKEQEQADAEMFARRNASSGGDGYWLGRLSGSVGGILP